MSLKRWLAGLCVVSLSSAIVYGATGEALIEAVRNGKIEVVRALLKQRIDVNAPQGDGATALHWAVHRDDLTTTELLIRAGARTNASDDTGVTPLYLACMNRNTSMVEKLLTAGADPNAALLNGETVLMMCARAGNAAAVKALLVRGADVNAKEPLHSQTTLMWATAQKRPEVVKVLLEAGADLRARSRVYAQNVTGEETQRSGRHALNYTVLRGGSTPLLFTARVGDVESTKVLVAAGADVNDALPDGNRALTVAAHSGHGALAAFLLEKGADPNVGDVGYTALHAAVLRGDLNLVKALLAHGANPNPLITKGMPTRRANGHDFLLLAPLIGGTPYLLAAQYLEVDIMRALAAGGADPRLAKRDGMTPLMMAVGMQSSDQTNRRGHRVLDGAKVEDENLILPAVTAALDLGGDINAVNSLGDTALHGAASQGYERVVQLLADRGALLNVKNKSERTPLGSLLSGATVGRGRNPGAVGDPDSLAGPSGVQSTIELLRKLGATP